MQHFLDGLGERHCTSRIMGSGTLSVASVAAGRAAGAMISTFHPEDHLAAVLLCREAGAWATAMASTRCRNAVRSSLPREVLPQSCARCWRDCLLCSV